MPHGRGGASGAEATGAPALSARGVTFAYAFRRVLDGLDLDLAAGEVLVVFGPNGAGKSTLLRVLAGLARPMAGEVRWWGRPVGALPPASRARAAFVGHGGHLHPELTARENLCFYARLLGLADPGRAADEALAAEGLALFADQRLAVFSRGMAQRLALRRAWLGAPVLLFADEPATGLDPEAAAGLVRALGDLRARGGAALLVSHDLAGALEWADRYVVLAGGRVADAGPTGPWRGRTAAFGARYRDLVVAARARALRGRRATPAPRPGGAAPPPSGDVPPRPVRAAGDGARRPARAPTAVPGDAPCAEATLGDGHGSGGRTSAGVPAPGPTPPGPARPVSAARALRAVLWKEAVFWGRAQGRLGHALAQGLLVATTFAFAFDPAAVSLRPVFAGILWLGVLFAALPAFGRSFEAEWRAGAVDGYLTCGGDARVLFYGKCLANLGALLLAEAVLVPAFLALLQVAPGAGLGGALAALLLGSTGFAAAGSLVAAAVTRALAGAAQGLLMLVALPLLAPVVFGTAQLAQGFLDGGGAGAGPWFWLLGAYALLFWALPAAVFPVVVEG